jgi:hypothetical protein
LNLGVGSFSEPGPGLFPFVFAIFLGGASSIYLAVFCLMQGGNSSAQIKSEEILWRRPGLVVLCLVIYSLFMVWIGYLVATFILLVILFNATPGAKREWKYTPVGALATVLLSYFVFSKLLQIPLPRGILGF